MQGGDQDPGDEFGDERTGDFAVEPPPLDDAPRDEPAGPPERYALGSWYDWSRHDWWFDSEPDPCPVQSLGHSKGGVYHFVTPRGEYRTFTSTQLHRSGGLADLFAARVWWLVRHFPGVDRNGNPTRRPNMVIAAEAMMRACVDAGFLSADIKMRLAGIWRDERSGRPVVHAGDALICDGEVFRPGTRLGAPLYVIAGRVERPATTKTSSGKVRYAAVGPDVGQTFVAAALNWTFMHDGAAELTVGFCAAGTLGDATDWRSHAFFRARPAGKSTLMRLLHAAAGGAGQDIVTTYSGPFIEQAYHTQARLLLLDENESDADPNRTKRITDLVKLLSDQGGAKGGRGGADGTARTLDVHGAVGMAATVRGQWKQQDRERITVLELDRFERDERPLLTHDQVEALIRQAEEMSPLLRARMLGRWDLFRENVALARKRIFELGGTARDGNQLGHLLAGWWTLTCDNPADADMLDDIGKRFVRWIVSINDAAEGTNPAMQCWNRMLGEDAHVWRGGETLTVGQVIARARERTNGEF